MARLILIIAWLLVLAFCPLQAQQLSNLSAVQSGNEVVIAYRLTGETGKAYHVTLFSSHNNFDSPLKFVEGAVNNQRLQPGNHTIRWNALDELKNFDGELTFEIRAVVAPPLFRNVKTSSQKVKRGKELTINWEGESSEPVKVELVKGTHRTVLGNGNQGKFTHTVSRKMKTGTYQVMLSSTGEVTHGESLKIAPKVSFLVKALPVMGVAALLILQPWKDDQKEDGFPEPPDLTSANN